ncbi:MAG: hypothetical protein ACRENE_13375 [Polyangiaceae bacterium]
MTRRRVGLGAWVAVACAAAAGAACSGTNDILIGNIPDSAAGNGEDRSIVGSGSGAQGSSSGAGGDATMGSTSGGGSGGDDGGGDATTSSSSSGANGSSGASSGTASSGSSGTGSSGAASSGSSGSSSGTNGSSGNGSSGAASSSGAGSSGSSDTSSGGSGSSSGGSSSGTSSGGSSGGSSSGGGNGCDSGGPLAFKSVWPMPTSTPPDAGVTNVTPTSIQTDAQGDVYVAGTFQGKITFGTTSLSGPTAVADSNMFLVKYSSTGVVLWAKQYGVANGIYVGPMIALDSAGNVFMGGSFNNTLSMGGNTPVLDAISLDAFAAKISGAGMTLWADHFGYNAGPYGVLSIAVGPDGDPVLAGVAGDTIVLGGTMWPAGASTNFPWLAKLNTSNGTVVWSNASGGNINSGEDIWVGVDGSNRVFLAARVESGGGSWGNEPDAGTASPGGTMRAGFDANGNIMWGQWDYGSFPVAASIDSAGRFNVLENASGTVTVDGTTAFNQGGGWDTLSLLFSPTDGSLLSGANITPTFTFPNGGAVDTHGNAFVTGTYWPQAGSIGFPGASFPASGNVGDHPVFVAATDGVSHGVGGVNLGGSNSAQPAAIAADSVSGNVYVAMTVPTAFTSSVGTLQAGAYLAVFSPDPCNDGAGPAGSSTGTAGNHGDLGPDASSPYVPVDAGAPAACPSGANAVNGAACPVARGCSYSPNECCFCSPKPCGDASTTWLCQSVANGQGCPQSPPTPGTQCSGTSLSCNYCTLQGRLVAQCTAGGWETLEAQIVCY